MICEICNKEFDNYKGLSSHIRQTHNITSKYYYDKYLKTENDGICPVCGKETPFIKISKGYQKHCCQTCSQKDPKVLEKVNKTRLEKYGVENFFQNKSIHKKAEKNAHSEEANKKKIETSQKHYGVDHPAQSEVVQSKMQQTNLERYGSRAYNRAKGRQTMKEKYDYEYALQVPEFKEKQEITESNKWIKLAQENNWLLVQDLLKKYGSGWYQSPLGKEICFKIGQQDFIKQEDLDKILLYKKCNGSYVEYVVYTWFLCNYNNKIELHNKTLISPYEIDIYLPDLKIGFECNGYFHRDNSYIDRNQDEYHEMKLNKCNNIGIKLIHIFEKDLTNLDTILKENLI